MLQSSTVRLALLLAIIFAGHAPCKVFAQADNAEASVEVVAQNLDTPWAVDFLPDGSMIFTERPGRVSVLSNGTLRAVGEIAVHEAGESGLLGIAVDPRFRQNRFVYLYYTHEDGGRVSNRISRFTLANQGEQGMRLENETVLLDRIPAAPIHDGGRLKFGPDGKLYATTGDAATPERAQDLSSLGGKVLRMNPDGTVPEDNPLGSLVYSYGHRNPQGLAWHPRTGELYASEHGPTQHDEINRIEPGADHGWPQVCGEQGVQPVRCYTESTLAPGGVAFVGDDAYIAGLRGAQVRVVSLVNGTAVSDEEFLSGYGRIRDVVEHDGYLYITTSNRDGRGVPRPEDDRILRIRVPQASKTDETGDARDPSAGYPSSAGRSGAGGIDAGSAGAGSTDAGGSAIGGFPQNSAIGSTGSSSAGIRQLGLIMIIAGGVMLVLGAVLPPARHKHARTTGAAHRREKR